MTDKPSEFAQVAFKHGLLSQEQLEECLALVRQAEADGSPTSLEELLVEEGYLTQDQVDAVQHRLVRELAGYKVVGKIGSGGMGSVYKAEQLSLGKIVALKILPPKYGRDQDFLARFEREARSLAKVNHRNIVRAIDFGKDKGYYFLSMEYVEGESLHRIVKDGGPLEEKRALEVAAQIADGLAHAAAHGLVHRDIKPENVLLTAEGEAKILDFGLAKPDEEKNASFQTTAGITYGTPHFMSPEQVRADEDIDTRSDLYSLGATLYYILTGKTPYEGKNDVEIMTAHLEKAVPDPRALVPMVSKSTTKVIRKLMAKERRDRYQTPADLLADIQRIQNGEAPRFTRGTTSAGIPRPQPSGGVPAIETHPSPRANRVTQIVLSVAGLLVLAVAGKALLLVAGRGPEEAGEAAPASPEKPPADGPAEPEDPVPVPKPEVRAALERLRGAAEGTPGELARAIEECDRLVGEIADAPAAAEVRQLREFLAARYDRRALAALDSVRNEANRLASELRFAEAVAGVREFVDEYSGSEAAGRATQVLFDLAAEEERAFARLVQEAEDLGSRRDYQGAASLLARVSEFANASLRERARSIAADYEELARANGTPGPGEEGPPKPATGDAQSWLAGAVAKARDRLYDDLFESSAAIDSPEVRTRREHVEAARLFLRFAIDRLARRPGGSALEFDGGRKVEFLRLEGDTLWVREDGAESSATAADLSAETLHALVFEDAPAGAAAAAGHFFALDGFPRSARQYLGEAGLDATAIDRVLSSWKTDEAGRVLVGPRDREARQILEQAKADLAAGEAAAAEKGFRRLLDKFADTYVVEQSRGEIEQGLWAARLALVQLENYFSGTGRKLRADVYSVQYRFADEAQRHDWAYYGPPPVERNGFLYFQDGFLDLWKGVWTDFELDGEFLFADYGDLRLRFRQESEGKFYELRIAARPSESEFKVHVRKRIPGENGDNPQEIAQDDWAKFFPEKGQTFQSRSRRLEIQATGSRIKIAINGRTAFEFEDAAIAKGSFAFQAGGLKAVKSLTLTGRLDPAWEAETRSIWLTRHDLVESAGIGPVIEGLHANGFEGKDFGKLLLRRVDPLVNFRWYQNTRPGEGMPGNGYSFRWRGWVLAPATGNYRFFTRNDDGVRLWVAEKQLIDDWKSHGPEDREGRLQLEKGVHPVVLEYFDDSGDAVIRWVWQYENQPRRLLDGRFLFHTRKDVR